jgi:hypothetical protein
LATNQVNGLHVLLRCRPLWFVWFLCAAARRAGGSDRSTQVLNRLSAIHCSQA